MILALGIAEGAVGGQQDRSDAMVLLPAGSLIPFFPRKPARDAAARPEIALGAFLLDRDPVSNRDFRRFLRRHPEWRRSAIQPVFADRHYLQHWASDLAWPKYQSPDQPVTNISWFAASAYCEAHGKTLPTTDQWEYALADQGRNQDALRETILTWYSRPNRPNLPDIRHYPANGYGLRALIGGAWEWTEDFNSATSGEELRSTDSRDRNLFCGGASLSAKDAADYAAFMRYSMRLSLKAIYATDNLGFRCAKEITS